MKKAFITSYPDQHKLGLKLKPILVGELYLTKRLKHPAYVFQDGLFEPVLGVGGTASKELVHELIKNAHRTVYVYPEDVTDIKKSLENALIKVTRSLSVGDPLENGTKDLKLLSLNMGGLYDNPHNDELLKLQFQSSQNLSKFLLENKKFQPNFYENLQKENFHFTLAQPMLSSLLLLSFLQSTHLFHEREIENLFLTSYMKDLGIAMIPKDKYDSKTLTTRDQELFANHADFSFDLLEGRVPLSKNYLNIIKYHHFLNEKIKSIVSKEKPKPNENPEMLFGLESTLVAVFDILVAMTNERPYRKGMSVYHSLELIKLMMADDYPQEFRAIVNFVKQFHKI